MCAGHLPCQRVLSFVAVFLKHIYPQRRCFTSDGPLPHDSFTHSRVALIQEKHIGMAILMRHLSCQGGMSIAMQCCMSDLSAKRTFSVGIDIFLLPSLLNAWSSDALLEPHVSGTLTCPELSSHRQSNQHRVLSAWVDSSLLEMTIIPQGQPLSLPQAGGAESQCGCRTSSYAGPRS